jgi:hypothetical protein
MTSGLVVPSTVEDYDSKLNYMAYQNAKRNKKLKFMRKNTEE